MNLSEDHECVRVLGFKTETWPGGGFCTQAPVCAICGRDMKEAKVTDEQRRDWRYLSALLCRATRMLRCYRVGDLNLLEVDPKLAQWKRIHDDEDADECEDKWQELVGPPLRYGSAMEVEVNERRSSDDHADSPAPEGPGAPSGSDDVTGDR